MRAGKTLQLKRYEATQGALKVTLLETLIRDLGNTAIDLAQQIVAEEERTKIKDTRHVAYSTFAEATALRRRNVLTSVADLKSKLDAAKLSLDEMTVQLRDLELVQNHNPPIFVAAEADTSAQQPIH